jgi:hypothetical protein
MAVPRSVYFNQLFLFTEVTRRRFVGRDSLPIGSGFCGMYIELVNALGMSYGSQWEVKYGIRIRNWLAPGERPRVHEPPIPVPPRAIAFVAPADVNNFPHYPPVEGRLQQLMVAEQQLATAAPHIREIANTIKFYRHFRCKSKWAWKRRTGASGPPFETQYQVAVSVYETFGGNWRDQVQLVDEAAITLDVTRFVNDTTFIMQ